MTHKNTCTNPKTEGYIMAITKLELEMIKRNQHETNKERRRKTLLQKSVEDNYDL